ncbi:hypothetical protein ACS0TY_034133 [Phlomoides rotata]
MSSRLGPWSPNGRPRSGRRGTKNLSYVAGDMFEAIPHADVALLKSVRILKKCKDAIGKSKEKCRKVIVIDMVLNNYEGGDTAMEDQLLYDMPMMTCLNSKERSEKEWAKIFSNAGFIGYKIQVGLGVRSLIEVYP